MQLKVFNINYIITVKGKKVAGGVFGLFTTVTRTLVSLYRPVALESANRARVL